MSQADARPTVIDIDDLREPRRTPEQQAVYEYGLAPCGSTSMAVLFLASDASTYTTGSVFAVDGGYLAV